MFVKVSGAHRELHRVDRRQRQMCIRDSQEKQVEEFEKLERRRLPPDMDYRHIQGLRLEAREKLAALRPENLGQAGRISGVSPADVAALMVYLHTRERPEGGKQA